jgi:hypothetical protein
MSRCLKAAAICAALLPLGCIVQSTTHTLLLDPDGALTWVVLERNARSDSDSPEERAREEGEFLTAARSGSNGAASSLRLLGGEGVAVEVLRDRRPFAVWTEARFASAADAAERFLAAHGVPACASFSTDGIEARLELSLQIAHDEASSDNGDDLGLPIPDDLDPLEILLTEGRFIAAEGFAFDGDRAELLPVTDEELEERGGALTLSLTWTTAPAPGG